MAKFLKIFVIGLTLAASGGWLGSVTPALAAKTGTYITLSSYYVLPGQSITIQGYRFSTNESVTLNVAGLVQTLTAGSHGVFSSESFTIPFSAIGSTVKVTATGSKGHSASANLVAGTFYGQAAPSSWYLMPGGQISFTGSRFAPGEAIAVQNAGRTLAVVNADASGNFATPMFTVPYGAGSLTYIFTGQSSQVAAAVTVTVGNEPPYLILDHYYVFPGDNLRVTGHAFGSGESVNVSLDGVTMGTATADSGGVFTFNFTVPPGSGGQESVAAVGSSTGKIAQTAFTLASQ